MSEPNTNGFVALVLALVSIASLLVGAGIYVGKLEARVDALEQNARYFHGGVELPSSKGQ